MKLREWLIQNNITQTEFAAMVGVTTSRINHLCHGTPDGRGNDGATPSHETALAIMQATDGAVMPADLGVVLREATLILAQAQTGPPGPKRTWGRKPKPKPDDITEEPDAVLPCESEDG